MRLEDGALHWYVTFAGRYFWKRRYVIQYEFALLGVPPRLAATFKKKKAERIARQLAKEKNFDTIRISRVFINLKLV